MEHPLMQKKELLGRPCVSLMSSRNNFMASIKIKQYTFILVRIQTGP